MTEIGVIAVTASDSYNYFFTYMIALLPVVVVSMLAFKLLSRS